MCIRAERQYKCQTTRTSIPRPTLTLTDTPTHPPPNPLLRLPQAARRLVAATQVRVQRHTHTHIQTHAYTHTDTRKHTLSHADSFRYTHSFTRTSTRATIQAQRALASDLHPTSPKALADATINYNRQTCVQTAPPPHRRGSSPSRRRTWTRWIDGKVRSQRGASYYCYEHTPRGFCLARLH